ncbi:MAG TPA: hypothetical protein VL199_04110 [Burkholderiales bacterium]|nr:hypothetical protein [Burkholderiales bacterium]
MRLWRTKNDDRFDEYEDAGFQVVRSWYSRRVEVVGYHAGITFTHYNIPPVRLGTGRVILAIKNAQPGELLVDPEDVSTKIAKGLGMVEEFQTGDPEVDEKYYFSGSTDEYVRQVFSDSQNVDATRRILAGTCTRLEKTEGELRAILWGQDFLPVDEVKMVVEQLARFKLPGEVLGIEREAISGRGAFALLGGVVALIGFPGYWGLTRSKPLVDGAWTFASHEAWLLGGLTVALLTFAYFVLKGHSMQVGLFFVLLVMSPLLVAAFAGWLMIYNEKFDRSEATSHEARLLRRYATTGKNSTYHLVFSSWRGQHAESFEVDYATYLRAQNRPRQWELRTRDGRLGETWVESMEVSTPVQDVRSPQ